MNQQIKTFLTIVDQKSMSGAARVLHYSQPTVSLYLNQLEKKLGVQLVRRTRGKREIALTPAGEAFVPLAQRFIDLDRQLAHFIQAQQKRVLRLAASMNAHEYVISNITHKLMRKDPDLEIRLSSVERREIELAIAERAFDVALMYGEVPKHPHIKAIPLYREARCILCPINTPLPDRIISPAELDRNYEITHTTYTNPIVAEWHEKYFPEDAKPFFVISSLMACYNYMTDPRCWILLPFSLANRLVAMHPGELTIRRCEPLPDPRVYSALVFDTYSDDKAIKNLVGSFDEYIDEYPYLEKVT